MSMSINEAGFSSERLMFQGVPLLWQPHSHFLVVFPSLHVPI